MTWNSYETNRELTNYYRGEQKIIKQMLYSEYMNGFLVGVLGSIGIVVIVILIIFL